MKYWNDFITMEDLVTESGEIDQDKVRALRLNTYFRYIEDFIELGGNQFPDVTSEMVEEFMTEDYVSYIHATEGRYPEPEETAEYLRQPENYEARKYWTYICVHADKENWPEFMKKIRDEWNVPEEITLKNEEQIVQMMEKTAKERTKKIREL